MSGLEVIGTVASIAQLAATAFSLSKTLYELGDAITNASEDIRSLAHDLSLFSQSLVQLQRLLDLNKGAYNLDIYILVERIIRECSIIHDKIAKLIRKLGKDGMKARFKWLYKEKRIRDLMTKLRDMKMTLLGILNTLQLDLQLTQLNISTESKIQRAEGDASWEYLEWKKLQEENARANTPPSAHMGTKTGEIGFAVTNIKVFSQNSSITPNSVSTGTTKVTSRGVEDDTRSIMTMETFKTAVSFLPHKPENNEGKVDLFGACEPREKAWRVEMAGLARAHFGMSEADATAWAEGLALPEALSKVSGVHRDGAVKVEDEVLVDVGKANVDPWFQTNLWRGKYPSRTPSAMGFRHVASKPNPPPAQLLLDQSDEELVYWSRGEGERCGDSDSDVTNPPPIIEEPIGRTQQESRDHWSCRPTQEDQELSNVASSFEGIFEGGDSDGSVHVAYPNSHTEFQQFSRYSPSEDGAILATLMERGKSPDVAAEAGMRPLPSDDDKAKLQDAPGPTGSPSTRGPRAIMQERQARDLRRKAEQEALERERAEDEARVIEEKRRKSVNHAKASLRRTEGEGSEHDARPGYSPSQWEFPKLYKPKAKKVSENKKKKKMKTRRSVGTPYPEFSDEDWSPIPTEAGLDITKVVHPQRLRRIRTASKKSKDRICLTPSPPSPRRAPVSLPYVGYTFKRFDSNHLDMSQAPQKSSTASKASEDMRALPPPPRPRAPVSLPSVGYTFKRFDSNHLDTSQASQKSSTASKASEDRRALPPPPRPRAAVSYTFKRFDSNHLDMSHAPQKSSFEPSQPVPPEVREESSPFIRYTPSYHQQSRPAPTQIPENDLPIKPPWQLNEVERRSKYQFEADSEDENSDDYLPITGYDNAPNLERLKAIASTKEDLNGTHIMTRIAAKTDTLDDHLHDQLGVSRLRLRFDRLVPTPSETSVSESGTAPFDLNDSQFANPNDGDIPVESNKKQGLNINTLSLIDLDVAVPDQQSIATYLEHADDIRRRKIDVRIRTETRKEWNNASDGFMARLDQYKRKPDSLSESLQNKGDGEGRRGDDAEISEEQEPSHEDEEVDDEEDTPGANVEKRAAREASSDTDTQPKSAKEANQSPIAQLSFPSNIQLSRLWWQAYAKLDNGPGRARSIEYKFINVTKFKYPVQDLTDDGEWATKTTEMAEKINNLLILMRNSPVPQCAELAKCLLKVDEIMKIMKTVEGTLGYNTAALGWYSICAVVIKILGFRPTEESTLSQIAEVAGLVARYAVMENIYHQWQGMTLKKEYEESLIDLCLRIFKYLVKASCVWRSKTLSDSHRDELKGLFDGIQEADQKCRTFRVIVDTDASTTKEVPDVLGSDDDDWDSDGVSTPTESVDRIEVPDLTSIVAQSS